MSNRKFSTTIIGDNRGSQRVCNDTNVYHYFQSEGNFYKCIFWEGIEGAKNEYEAVNSLVYKDPLFRGKQIDCDGTVNIPNKKYRITEARFYQEFDKLLDDLKSIHPIKAERYFYKYDFCSNIYIAVDKNNKIMQSFELYRDYSYCSIDCKRHLFNGLDDFDRVSKKHYAAMISRLQNKSDIFLQKSKHKPLMRQRFRLYLTDKIRDKQLLLKLLPEEKEPRYFYSQPKVSTSYGWFGEGDQKSGFDTFYVDSKYKELLIKKLRLFRKRNFSGLIQGVDFIIDEKSED